MGATCHNVDLGCLELMCSNSDLRLRLSSAAELATSEEDAPDQSSPLTAESLSSRGHRKWWVRKAQRYCFILELHNDHAHISFPEQTIGQRVASRLRYAKIWSKLQLSVSAIEVTSTSQAGCEAITISLEYDDARSSQAQKKLHKLAQGVPSYDIGPPAGIPCVLLQRTHLVASVSGIQGFDGSDCSAKPEADSSQHQHYEVKPCTLNKEKAALQSAKTALAYTSAPELYATPPSSQEIVSEFPRSRHLATNHDYVLSLLEAGLKLAICDCPTRLHTSITIRSNESFRSLADVFPELWSPKYLSKVAGRSTFLPTLAHASMTVTQHSVIRPSLTAKFAQISRQAHVDATTGEISQQVPVTLASKSLSMALWRHTSHSLYDPEASRSLLVLSLPDKRCDSEVSSLEEVCAVAYEGALDEEVPNDIDYFSDSDESGCFEDDDLLTPDCSESALGELDDCDDNFSDSWDWALEGAGCSLQILNAEVAVEDSFNPSPSADFHNPSSNTHYGGPRDACMDYCLQLAWDGDAFDIGGRAQPDWRDYNPLLTDTGEEQMLDE